MFAMFTLLPFNEININEALMFNTTPYLTLRLWYNTCRPIIINVYLEYMGERVLPPRGPPGNFF